MHDRTMGLSEAPVRGRCGANAISLGRVVGSSIGHLTPLQGKGHGNRSVRESKRWEVPITQFAGRLLVTCHRKHPSLDLCRACGGEWGREGMGQAALFRHQVLEMSQTALLRRASHPARVPHTAGGKGSNQVACRLSALLRPPQRLRSSSEVPDSLPNSNIQNAVAPICERMDTQCMTLGKK